MMLPTYPVVLPNPSTDSAVTVEFMLAMAVSMSVATPITLTVTGINLKCFNTTSLAFLVPNADVVPHQNNLTGDITIAGTLPPGSFQAPILRFALTPLNSCNALDMSHDIHAVLVYNRDNSVLGMSNVVLTSIVTPATPHIKFITTRINDTESFACTLIFNANGTVAGISDALVEVILPPAVTLVGGASAPSATLPSFTFATDAPDCVAADTSTGFVLQLGNSLSNASSSVSFTWTAVLNTSMASEVTAMAAMQYRAFSAGTTTLPPTRLAGPAFAQISRTLQPVPPPLQQSGTNGTTVVACSESRDVCFYSTDQRTWAPLDPRVAVLQPTSPLPQQGQASSFVASSTTVTYGGLLSAPGLVVGAAAWASNGACIVLSNSVNEAGAQELVWIAVDAVRCIGAGTSTGANIGT